MRRGADISVADKYGVTPLMVAFRTLNKENIEHLIKNYNLSVLGTNIFSGQNVFHILTTFGFHDYDYVFEKAVASCPELIKQQ